MRFLIRSSRDRWHIAYRAGEAWLGLCGSVITRPTERRTAISAAQLSAFDGGRVCFYCLAIGSEASAIEARATEAVMEAGRARRRA